MAEQPARDRESNAALKQDLVQREAELAILNSVQQGLASHLEVQDIYDLVGEKIREIFKAQIVMISFYDQETNTIEHRYAIERDQRVCYPGHHSPGGFRTKIIQTRQPLLVNANVAIEATRLRQPTLPGTQTPKSWLGVPMIVGGNVTGILSLQNLDQEYAFRETDVRLLQILAASMSAALENARLWEQENLYHKAVEREFEIGRRIQAGFLPDVLPQPEGWEIAASLQPAREVAGDFYDVFDLPGEKIGLVIADVCDKGLGAALFMTLFRSLLRAVSNLDFYARVSPGAGKSSAERLKNAISLTNNYIAETHADISMFATIFFGILETRTGLLTYINGGHMPPMVINQSGLKKKLRLTGPAVGVFLDIDYEIQEVSLNVGDVLFAYTDGLTDIENPAGKSFCEDILISLLMVDQALGLTLARIQRKAKDFYAGEKQIDDITMLAIRRLN